MSALWQKGHMGQTVEPGERHGQLWALWQKGRIGHTHRSASGGEHMHAEHGALQRGLHSAQVLKARWVCRKYMHWWAGTKGCALPEACHVTTLADAREVHKQWRRQLIIQSCVSRQVRNSPACWPTECTGKRMGMLSAWACAWAC
eukprot:359430-Chlamydomonas_euryale.AAC.7